MADLLPFKKGPFHLAAETGFPIVPVTILETEDMMPKGHFAVRPGTATLVFHAPVDPRKFNSREELMQAVRDVINEFTTARTAGCSGRCSFPMTKALLDLRG